jgi:hypothetical protein
LNAVINDNSEEDDYKEDAPAETSGADVIGAYDVQLEQQGMSIAEALKIHHPSTTVLIQKWGEIPYEDTPEAIKSEMHSQTDAE